MLLYVKREGLLSIRDGRNKRIQMYTILYKRYKTIQTILIMIMIMIMIMIINLLT